MRINSAAPLRKHISDLEAKMSGAEEEAVGGADRNAIVDEPLFVPQETSRDAISSLLQKERELDKRERELLRLEIELVRRENEQLRSTMEFTAASNTRTVSTKINLTNLKEMLSSFDGKKTSYQCWKEQLLMVRRTYQIDDNIAKLLVEAKLTGDAEEWFHSVPTYISLPFDELLRHMDGMYGQRETKLALRRQFENRMWQYDETFAEYYHKKIILANKVPIDEEKIVDYVIDGIPIKSIKNQAMMQQFPDKETMLRAMENITLRSEPKMVCKTEKTSDARNVAKAGSVKGLESDSNVKQEPKCYNCNKMGHMAAKCSKPKYGQRVCFKCWQTGHQSKDCPSRELVKHEAGKDEGEKKADVNIVNSVISTDIGNFCREVTYQLKNETEEFFMNCKLDTLLNTGSPISFMKDIFVPPNLVTPITLDNAKYYGLNDSELEAKGRVIVEMALNNSKPRQVTLLVVPAGSMKPSVVIGQDVLKQFFYREKSAYEEEAENAIIREILNIQVDEKCPSKELNINPEIDNRTRTVAEKLFAEEYIKPERPEQSQIDAKIKLRLKVDKPFHFSVSKHSYTEKKELRVLLDSLLDKQIIRPSKSEYASPMVLVRKKTGDLRLCIDYRALNELLVRDNYPLPNIEDLIDSLHDQKYFTRLDLKNGFYPFKMSEESIKYTAFTTPFGQFEFLRMPFGLKVAPSQFQRYINQVLAEPIRQRKVIVYMDDILVISVTIEQHLKILQEVFRLFVTNKLELRIDKCAFLQTEIEFLGYLVSEKGISSTKEGVKSVQRIPVPRNIREMDNYVALCSYFRKFIPSFSLIAKPLYNLLRKNVPFKIGADELRAFQELKAKITNAPVLAVYSPTSETELHCDASMAGFGSVLMQRGKDKQFHPIFFFSKRTTDVESRYHSFELEMLAIIYSLRRFKVYLRGVKFKIVTDCNALTLAFKKKEISPLISRWVLELLEYDYSMEHRLGTKMGHVDALSRLPGEIMIVNDNAFELNLGQNQDSKLSELKEILRKSDNPDFEMRNGIVFKKYHDKLLFYVPQAMELQVMHKYHDEMDHLGVKKTYGNVIKSYWFPDMKLRIKEYISNCRKCISFNPLMDKQEEYLHCIPKSQSQFEIYHVNHYGPIDKEQTIKRYLLVVIDSFTKYVKLYPTKTTATSEVIDQLTIHFSNYSRPRIIISDKEPAFTSHEFELFCKDNNVRHILTATHSPKDNEQVEWVNRILGPMISKLINNDAKRYWYKIVSDIEFALNNFSLKITNDTPSKLLFGVNQRGKIIDVIQEYLLSTATIDPDLIRLRERASEWIKRNQK